MGFREGGAFVVFPEIAENVLSSWESAAGDREREVKLSGSKAPKALLWVGRESSF